MNKILIIIGREFSTRVKKKSFLITTIAVPLLFVAFYAFLMWMMLKKTHRTGKLPSSTLPSSKHRWKNQ